MAALETMEQGSLKSEFRHHSSGRKSGPYFKHQVWREGANASQRISLAEAPALETAIGNRQRFESLAADFVALTVAHTRQNSFPDSLKKKILPAASPRKQNSRR